MRHDCIHFMTRLYATGLHPFLWQNGMRQDCIYFSQYCMRQDCIHFDDKMVWDMTAFILWQDCMRQDCIHFYDKMAWDRTASIFHNIVWDRLHPFLWQNGMRQGCIYFLTRLYETGLHSFLMTSQHKTGTHPSISMTSQHKTGTIIHFYDKPA